MSLQCYYQPNICTITSHSEIKTPHRGGRSRLDDAATPVEDEALAIGVPKFHISPSSTLPILISLLSRTISIPPQSPLPSSSSSSNSSSTSMVAPDSEGDFFMRSRRA